MNQRLVVDASLVAKWFLQEEDTPQATALLHTWAASGTALLAPMLLADELCNILYPRVVRGLPAIDDARDALQAALGLVTLDGDQGISLRALEIAHRLGLPAAYDVHYLALAEREGCEMWTSVQHGQRSPAVGTLDRRHASQRLTRGSHRQLVKGERRVTLAYHDSRDRDEHGRHVGYVRVTLAPLLAAPHAIGL